MLNVPVALRIPLLAVAMSKEGKDAVFAGVLSEDSRLENLGYEQGMRSKAIVSVRPWLTLRLELKRSFGLLGMIGFSFSVVTS